MRAYLRRQGVLLPSRKGRGCGGRGMPQMFKKEWQELREFARSLFPDEAATQAIDQVAETLEKNGNPEAAERLRNHEQAAELMRRKYRNYRPR